MIRAIIIDDEPLARVHLHSHLKLIGGVEIVGEYENGFDGLKGIALLKPDLIFLDVQMPKLNGFEMLELMDEVPSVIFTTAYNEYAVKAFEQNAVDYLLKPYNADRLRTALERAADIVQKPEAKKRLESMLQHNHEQFHKLERIAVKIGIRIKIIYLQEIDYIEAQDDYVMIHTREGKYLKQNTMKYFEDHLPEKSFVRVHRSYIVRTDNVAQIELYEKDSYQLKLRSGNPIPVSKSGYSRLRDLLQF